MRESLKVLRECAELQSKKSQDYQNPKSSIVQSDYYPRGVLSLMDTIHAKYLRACSLVEATDHGEEPNFESLEDTFKDMINYCSFAAAWCRGGIPGQTPDMTLTSNRPQKKAPVDEDN
jgi:hypothetical protein